MVVPWAMPSHDVQSRTVEVPFVEDNGHIFLEGRINGVGPVWMTLDTGAGTAAVDVARAPELKISGTGQVRATGAGGAETIQMASGIEFALPGLALPRQSAGLIPLGFISQRVGRPIAAILGYELFREFVVEIDYHRQRLSLHDPRTYRYQGVGTVVPLEFDRNLPYMTASLSMATGGVARGQFVIDLGSNVPVMVSEAYARTHSLLRPADRRIDLVGRGVGGDVHLVLARAAGLDIQGVTLAGPIVGFPRNLGGLIAAEDSVGNIGAALLRRFRVTFDYSRRRMILEKTASFGEPFESDMSGLALVTSGPRFEVVSIARIVAGTPAEQAGLRAGDRVLEVDGTPVPDVAAIRRLLRQEGRRVTLRIARGEERLTCTVTLRRLI